MNIIENEFQLKVTRDVLSEWEKSLKAEENVLILAKLNVDACKSTILDLQEQIRVYESKQ